MIHDGTLGGSSQIRGALFGKPGFKRRLALRSIGEPHPAGMTSLGIHIVDAFINMFGPISSAGLFQKPRDIL